MTVALAIERLRLGSQRSHAARKSPADADRRALESLLDSLTRAGFPTVQRLRPGLSDDEMDSLTAPLGLTLPHEARIWWRRHNGGPEALIGSYRDFASLQDIVAQTRRPRDVHHHGFQDAGVITWMDDLIALVTGTTQFGCDCSVATGEPSPIWVLVPSDAADIRGPVLPSLGSLVEQFMRAIDEGVSRSSSIRLDALAVYSPSSTFLAEEQSPGCEPSCASRAQGRSALTSADA